MTDFRASAAKCRDMAGKSPEKDKVHWLRMEQFWLGKASEADQARAIAAEKRVVPNPEGRAVA